MKKLDPESKEFGQRIRKLRVQLGLSAETVAQKVEVSPSTYREWENGRAITGMPYRKLASTFGLSIGELFSDPSNKLKEVHEALDQISSAVKRIRLHL